MIRAAIRQVKEMGGSLSELRPVEKVVGIGVLLVGASVMKYDTTLTAQERDLGADILFGTAIVSSVATVLTGGRR